MSNSNQNNSGRLTSGAIKPMLAKMAAPMVFGIFSMVIFQLADTYFIGRLGTRPLAAISFTFPVVLFINSLALGIGVGAGAVISRAIGAGDQHRIRTLTTHSLLLGLFVVGIFVISGLLTIRPLFRLLGAEADIVQLIEQYMNIWYLGMIFVVIPMVGNNAIRATGDTLTPGLIMGLAAIINIILDPFLILGLGPFPRLGISGAALATVIGRSVTFTVALYVLAVREDMIPCAASTVKQLLASWKEILHIGLPTAFSRMVLPVGTGIITRLLSYYGAAAVAAYGVATRIEFFGMTVILAISSVVAPFVGQNRGAELFGRIKRGIQTGKIYSIGWGLIFGITVILTARPIAYIFNSDPTYISTLVSYLRIVPITYGLHGIMLVSAASLNVLKHPLLAAGLVATEMFVLCVPLGWLLSFFMGPTGIFFGLAAGFILAGIGGHLLLNKIIRREEKIAEDNINTT
ncbi:MAG: MATE family efflux transporter [bacterium]